MTCFVSVITSATGCIPHSSGCYPIDRRSELMDILRQELDHQGFRKDAIADFGIRKNWPYIRQGHTWSRDSYDGRGNQMTAFTITEDEFHAWYQEYWGEPYGS